MPRALAPSFGGPSVHLLARPGALGTVAGMEPHDKNRKLLGYPEIAEITGYSIDRLRHLKCEGNFPSTTGPGRKVLVHPEDLDLWLSSNRTAA